ncbi:type II toxin-antitoxin system PemK/MazF family toxin [Rhizobium sp. NTR19]|uniref:Type II toxin-antitoxin system PemK/MazF family toxin n=1 Tax=Neorhizobium turbinariae TaxID=2937795 RepID=A0ABT0IWC5_9HYPH|nr:type II toxin-antitoxin system PemK/MazF family toxin [Neorhizobium turbinariae]MCK8782186.1 type II toxin-antitoxin system PemK/MazF family toxin [Neorhizobium turbinariae]
MVTAAFQGDLGKPRPAVILQADECIEDHVTLLLCPFSTFLTDAAIFRPTVVPSPENGLQATSQIMVDKMTHLRKPAIGRVIGRLNDDEMQRLEAAVIAITGLRQSVLPIAGLQHLGEQQ